MVSAADRDGTVVTVVHSNSFPRFGSGIVVPGYDLVLANRAGRGFDPHTGAPELPGTRATACHDAPRLGGERRHRRAALRRGDAGRCQPDAVEPADAGPHRLRMGVAGRARDGADLGVAARRRRRAHRAGLRRRRRRRAARRSCRALSPRRAGGAGAPSRSCACRGRARRSSAPPIRAHRARRSGSDPRVGHSGSRNRASVLEIACGNRQGAGSRVGERVGAGEVSGRQNHSSDSGSSTQSRIVQRRPSGLLPMAMPASAPRPICRLR